MTKLFLNTLLVWVMLTACDSAYRFDKDFSKTVEHTVFFDKGPYGKDKFSWSPVRTFKPFNIVYQPEKQQLIFNRSAVPDTFHYIPLTDDQLKQVKKEYGKFRFLGAFECYNVPPEFTSLMYVNPENNDLMEVMKITTSAKGEEKFMRAVIYMKDTINYMQHSPLFAKPDQLKQ